MLNFVTLCTVYAEGCCTESHYAEGRYAEVRYAEDCYAESHYAEGCYAECRGAFQRFVHSLTQNFHSVRNAPAYYTM
jgi:hypothetical protein